MVLKNGSHKNKAKLAWRKETNIEHPNEITHFNYFSVLVMLTISTPVINNPVFFSKVKLSHSSHITILTMFWTKIIMG